MRNIVPNKKQKLLLAEKYRKYLSEGPKPTDKLHNKYNIFDDLNSIDKVMMKEAKIYIARSGGAIDYRVESEEIIKKPKQVKMQPKARYG